MDRRHALPGAPSAGALRPHRGPMGRRRESGGGASTTGSPTPGASSWPTSAGSGRPWTRRSGSIWSAMADCANASVNHVRSPRAELTHGPETHRQPGVGSLEKQIEPWRAHLRKSQTITSQDVAELEDHLREQIASLVADGLSDDEAFLVAVKRMGSLDALTREFAREHSDRLWKQLVLVRRRRDRVPGHPRPAGPGRCGSPSAWPWRRPWRSRSRRSSGSTSTTTGRFYPRNIGFFILPFIAAYFAWNRPLPRSGRLGLAVVFAAAAVVANAFPFSAPRRHVAHTVVLTALHLPIALWLAVGIAYVGGRWRGSEQADGLRPLLRRTLHLLRPDRPGRRRPHRADHRPLPGHRHQGGTVSCEDWILPCGIAGPPWSPPGSWRRSRA